MVWLRRRRTGAQLVGRDRRDLRYFRRGLPSNAEALGGVRGLFRRRGRLSRVVGDNIAGERSGLGTRCFSHLDGDYRRRSGSAQQCPQFHWRSETDFDPIWEQRTYYLSRVTDVDLIMSYWMGEAIAHTIVSFGFDDRSRLAFSIETRKESHESHSSIAGFFKQYELSIIAADEHDVVRVRSNIRGEDVRIYRLRMTPENARLLLHEYLAEANDLAATPRFYNTLTPNCTTLVFDMVRVIQPGLPLDPRVILAGYLPNYAYAVGATDTTMPFDALRELSRIHDKALRADADSDFSSEIREGIPVPY